MGLTIDFAIAKTNKYASRESGDTAELVERPNGGVSVVCVDGQGSGPAAKTLSLLVTSKAVALLKEGVRDGAVARGVHDHLFAFRHGKVSASLDILSVDLCTNTVVVTRNGTVPMLVGCAGVYDLVPCEAGPIGRYHLTRPAVLQWPADVGLQIVLITDGIAAAGQRDGEQPFDLAGFAAGHFASDDPAERLADPVLDEAVRRDGGRPADDMTVVAPSLRAHRESTLVRRLAATVPVP